MSYWNTGVMVAENKIASMPMYCRYSIKKWQFLAIISIYLMDYVSTVFILMFILIKCGWEHSGN